MRNKTQISFHQTDEETFKGLKAKYPTGVYDKSDSKPNVEWFSVEISDDVKITWFLEWNK